MLSCSLWPPLRYSSQRLAALCLRVRRLAPKGPIEGVRTLHVGQEIPTIRLDLVEAGLIVVAVDVAEVAIRVP